MLEQQSSTCCEDEQSSKRSEDDEVPQNRDLVHMFLDHTNQALLYACVSI
jgi:hypothetical protein